MKLLWSVSHIIYELEGRPLTVQTANWSLGKGTQGSGGAFYHTNAWHTEHVPDTERGQHTQQMPFMAEQRRLLLGSSNNEESDWEWVPDTAQGETMGDKEDMGEVWLQKKRREKQDAKRFHFSSFYSPPPHPENLNPTRQHSWLQKSTLFIMVMVIRKIC